VERSELPQDLRDLMDTMACGNCHTPTGKGFLVTVNETEPGHFEFNGRCLACGAAGILHLRRPVTPSAAPVAVPQIPADEVIDFHEAIQREDWWDRLRS
jgi:hypothetical protein